MNKQELAKQYADKKLSENPRNVYNKLPLGMEKSETNFDGYDIEQAYEDGFDKAVELACEWIYNNAYLYIDGQLEIEDFKKYMEGKDDGTQTKFMGSYTTTTETDNGKKYKDYRNDK